MAKLRRVWHNWTFEDMERAWHRQYGEDCYCPPFFAFGDGEECTAVLVSALLKTFATEHGWVPDPEEGDDDYSEIYLSYLEGAREEATRWN